MTRPFLTLALVAGTSLLSLPLGSCDRSGDTSPTTGTPTTPPTPTTPGAGERAGERTGRAVDNAARDTAAATRDSRMPGMPSVTGTDTSNMSTADAAAQRLIDNARENIKQNDTGKAKTLLGELKQEGMYGKLSPAMKANVDQLERELQGSGTGTTTPP